MEKGKRFVVIEDLLEWQAQIRSALEASGHIVVGRAATLAEALALIPKFKKLKVDAVTLDGNLCLELDTGREPGDDARDIMHALRQKFPKVKVIGMSRDYMEGADISVGKPPEFRLKDRLDHAIETLFKAKK